MDPHEQIDEREAAEARLTAYALGQLDEAEREAVERELAGDADAARGVEDIRALAEHVREACGTEDLPEVSDELRQRIAQLVEEEEPPMRRTDSIEPSEQSARRYRRRSLWATAAASFIAGGTLVALLLPAVRPPQEAPTMALHVEPPKPAAPPTVVTESAVTPTQPEAGKPTDDGGKKPSPSDPNSTPTPQSQSVYPRMVPPLLGEATGMGPYDNYGPQVPNSNAYPPPGSGTSLADPTMTGSSMFSMGAMGDAGIVGSIIVDEQNFDWRRGPATWEDIRSGRAWRGDGQRFRLETPPGMIDTSNLDNFTAPLAKTSVTGGTTAIGYNSSWAAYNSRHDSPQQGSPQSLYGAYYAGGQSTIRGHDVRGKAGATNSAQPGTNNFSFSVGHERAGTVIQNNAGPTASITPPHQIGVMTTQSLGTPTVRYAPSAPVKGQPANGQANTNWDINGATHHHTTRHATITQQLNQLSLRQDTLLQSLNAVEQSNVTVGGNVSIYYPSAEAWNALSTRRSEQHTVELSSRNAAEHGQPQAAGWPAKQVDGLERIYCHKLPDGSPTVNSFYDPRVTASYSGYTVGKPVWQTRVRPSTEQYAPIVENPFVAPYDSPLSTFSIDVDTASYANVRRFLDAGQFPPPNAVRVEELVNYFSYDYPKPEEDEAFSVDFELADCPWAARRQLLRIGLAGREIERGKRGISNLVFLLDVSGSMADQDKLPLVKKAMRLLVDQLDENDRVAIVTYANEAAVRLESTNGQNKQAILDAIDDLAAKGSTNGSGGIQLAYEQAAKNFLAKGNNRVILATDGDLNVGITDDDELVKLIKEKAASGVFLSVLGFGTGNLKDGKLEKLADHGNGNYSYIDSLREARKVLVEELTGSLWTIAKDVKIQIEFNPARVAAYRLIGYENRKLAARDFNNDKKDAGEIGAGHTVTALYELVPTNSKDERGDLASVPPLKYQKVVTPVSTLTKAADTDELATVRLRYKQPDGEKSRLIERVVRSSGASFSGASPDFQFASAVASFAMILRGSRFKGDATFEAVEEYATPGLANDPGGHRAAFVDLVQKARGLRRQIVAKAPKRQWGPEQATGEPDTPQAGDLPTAWASLAPSGGPEWLKVDFDQKVNVAEVRIRESFNPGAVTKVAAIVDGGREDVLWEGTDPTSTAPADFPVAVERDVTTKSIKIYLDTTRRQGWNEIDAVELVAKDGTRQWASQATASSTYAKQTTPQPSYGLSK